MVDFSSVGISASAQAIRDLKNENKALKKLALGHAVKMRERQKQASRLAKGISDYRSAFMEWMPMLRHSGNETAQTVAAAMRKLMDDIERRLSG